MSDNLTSGSASRGWSGSDSPAQFGSPLDVLPVAVAVHGPGSHRRAASPGLPSGSPPASAAAAAAAAASAASAASIVSACATVSSVSGATPQVPAPAGGNGSPSRRELTAFCEERTRSLELARLAARHRAGSMELFRGGGGSGSVDSGILCAASVPVPPVHPQQQHQPQQPHLTAASIAMPVAMPTAGILQAPLPVPALSTMLGQVPASVRSGSVTSFLSPSPPQQQGAHRATPSVPVPASAVAVAAVGHCAATAHGAAATIAGQPPPRLIQRMGTPRSPGIATPASPGPRRQHSGGQPPPPCSAPGSPAAAIATRSPRAGPAVASVTMPTSSQAGMMVISARGIWMGGTPVSTPSVPPPCGHSNMVQPQPGRATVFQR